MQTYYLAISALLLGWGGRSMGEENAGRVYASGPVYSPSTGASPPVPVATALPMTTQTVFGFLDFTTTIANTVMVFSPQSQAAAEIKPTETKKIEATKASVVVEVSRKVEVGVKDKKHQDHVEHSIKPPIPTKSSHTADGGSSRKEREKKIEVGVDKKEKSTKPPPPPPSPTPGDLNNNLDQEILAKEPSEKISETYKGSERRATKSVEKQPLGLVTKLGGTVVKDGQTTIHETSVIGTYISGKYAQVLKATSEVLRDKKTALDDGLPLESLFTSPGQSLIRHSRRPSLQPSVFKNRLHRTKVPPQESLEQTTTPPLPAQPKKKARPFKLSQNRFSRPTSSSEIATVSVFTEQSARRYQRQRSASVLSNTIESGGSRRFKPKVNPSSVLSEPSSTSLYKFKLSRPQGRWQYKSSPKPRVSIRRQDEDADGKQPAVPSPSGPIQASPTLPELETSEQEAEISLPSAASLASSAAPTPSLSLQTIKVEISTPANFSNLYYEIATIKSPYTFQVGTVKNTRFITLTSTYEKLLEESSSVQTEPLTENILTSTPAYEREGTIVTLPVIAIAGSETLPLETMTDIFSTSEILLKTHLLPVVQDSNTTTLTLVQTYEVTKVVSATKTLPPTELFQFIPSKTLNEFNSRLDEAGSELHLELEFGDNNENDEDSPHPVTMLPADLANLTETTSPAPPVTPPPQEQLTPEKLQQLALLRFLNPNQPPIVTSTPVLSVETLFETHVLPVFNGLSTVFSTIKRPIKTLTKTEFMTNTLSLPSLPLPLFPSQQQLQQQAFITSTPIVTQTVVTQTDSKVLKLTFGAKTAYTTLYSTKVIPTLLTTYLTSQLPLPQTIPPFPSPLGNPFFPPFNPYQFVG